jgi:phosphate transport system substrate-binding protein
MLLMRCAALALLGLAVVGTPTFAALRVVGSTTVNPVVAQAAEVLRREQGLAIEVDTLGGSSGGILAVGEGRADVGMSSKPLSDSDRRRRADLVATPIGWDAVALVVAPDVVAGGLTTLSREQMRQIFERKVTNWRELGGPDRRIVFFNKEPGRGTFEVFATWLYGGVDQVPSVAHREVGSNEEGRTKVASTPGAISQLSFAWVDGTQTVALGLLAADGSVVRPTLEAIGSGRYPLVRPLLLVTAGEPSAEAKILLDFLLSPRGQAIVERHGYLPLGSAPRSPAGS